MYGIIDVGSNTVRSTIYKIEDGTAKLLLNNHKALGLASYVKDDMMQQEGIDKVVKLLKECKVVLDHVNVPEYHAFATAALRNVKNSKEAVAEIVERSGIELEVLSGELQAELDFLGAKHTMEMTDGLLIDIGGASTELVAVRDGKMVSNISFPIGSLNAYEEFVTHILPTRSERKAIKQAVLREIEKIPRLSNVYQDVYGIGGTLRATSKLNKYLFQLPDDVTSIKVPNIKKMIKLLENLETMDTDIPVETLDVLLKAVPGRVQTILPGMIILHTVAKYYKAQNIKISTAGVREGYLYKFIVGETTPVAAVRKKRVSRKER